MTTHKVIVEVTKDTIVSTDEFITVRKHQYKKEIVFICAEFRNSYVDNQRYVWCLEYIRDDEDDKDGLILLSKPPLNITIN